MDREYYLGLARVGLRMPIGTDLILHEKPDHEQIVLNGYRLGQVYEEAAERWGSPMAWPLMDLTLEKRVMLERLGVPAEQIDTYHFDAPPTEEMAAKFTGQPTGGRPTNARVDANLHAISYIARNTDLVPVGMSIGPFSLVTKLMADPITAVYLAGTGATAEEESEIRTLDVLLGIATQLVLESITQQVQAGAKAIFVAEPAANKVYFSPNQLDAGSDIFSRYAMTPNHCVKKRLNELGADLIFHCCGELTDSMVKSFAWLDPAILSLGSSRRLWEDAALVPKNIVLYGNLPSKQFYSDDLITKADVENKASELVRRMKAAGHPFILGSECDVLSVPGAELTIKDKVMFMLRAPAACCCGGH